MFLQFTELKKNTEYFFGVKWEEIESRLTSAEANSGKVSKQQTHFVWQENLTNMALYLENEVIPLQMGGNSTPVIDELELSLHPTQIYDPQCLPEQNRVSFSLDALKAEYNILKALVANKMTYFDFNPKIEFSTIKFYVLESILYEYYCKKGGKKPKANMLSCENIPHKRIKTTTDTQTVREYFMQNLNVKNSDGAQIMSKEEVEHFLYANFDGFFPRREVVCFKPKISVGNLRHIFYDFYTKYACNAHDTVAYAVVMHLNFEQFKKAKLHSTQKNFSKIPSAVYKPKKKVG